MLAMQIYITLGITQMRARQLLLIVSALAAISVVATSCTYEFKAQRTSSELFEKVKRSAIAGDTRVQVERALQKEGLPYQYSAPSNAIISPWIPVGRFRLFWETQFYFQINFDENGKVTGFRTERFNEGL